MTVKGSGGRLKARRGKCGVVAYLDATCVFGLEGDDGLSSAGDFNLILRAKPRDNWREALSIQGRTRAAASCVDGTHL